MMAGKASTVGRQGQHRRRIRPGRRGQIGRGGRHNRYRRLGRLAVTLAAVGLLSGCWYQVGYGAEHGYYNAVETKLTRSNVGNLEQDWDSAVSVPKTEAVVSGSRLYVAVSSSGSTGQPAVAAMDASTGEPLWTTAIGLSWAHLTVQPVVVVDGVLWVSYFGWGGDRCSGAMVRLDAATGASLGTVYEGSASAAVRFGDKIAWTGYALDPSYRCAPSLTTELIVADLASGSPLWTAPVSNLALPAVVGDKIVVSAKAYPAAGCGVSSCTPVWDAALGEPVRTQAGSSDGHFFVTTGVAGGATTIHSLDPTTGAELWSGPTGSGDSTDRAIAVAGNSVYVGMAGTNATLRVFPIDGCGAPTCGPAWSAELSGSYAGGPVVAAGVVYMTSSSRLAAYPAEGCGRDVCGTLTWLDSPGGPMSVANGKVFVSQSVASTNNRVFAYAPAG